MKAAYAQAVAQRYGTDHHLLPVRSDVRADLPRLVAAMGEPFADVSAVNLFAIAQVARQSVTVVLTGDGGDEAFGGYTEFFAAHHAGRIYGILPAAVRSLLWRLVKPMQMGPRLLHRAGTFLRMATMPLEKSFGELHPREACRRSNLYTAEFMADLHGRHPHERTFELLAAARSESWCDRIMQAHLLTVLPDDFLPKVDLATIGASLKARSPFLDIDVIELAMRIPAAVRLCDRQPKGLLRRLARRHLPPAGVDRRKQGFTAPVGLWFRNNWQDLTREFILGPHVERRGWFRRAALEQLVDEHQRGRNHGHLLWALLVLELWLRLALNTRSAQAMRSEDRPAAMIVHMIGQLDRGGSEKQLFSLATALVRRGWRQAVVSFQPGGVWASRIAESGIPVACVPRTGMAPWRFWQLRRLIRSWKPRVIVSWSGHVAVYADWLFAVGPVARVLSFAPI